MKKPSIDLIKYRWIWFGISLAILIPGLIGIIMCSVQFHAPLKLGIDFTGGSILQYQFEKPVELDLIRAVLDRDGFPGSQVQQAVVSGHNVIVMRTKAMDDEGVKRKLDGDLIQQFGQFKILSVDKVSGTMDRNFCKAVCWHCSLPLARWSAISPGVSCQTMQFAPSSLSSMMY